MGKMMGKYIHDFKKAEGADLLVYDIQCEQAALGTLMSEINAYGEYSQMLSAELFYEPKHQDIFKAIQSVVRGGGQPDLLSVMQELQRMGSEVTPQELMPISSAGVRIDVGRNVAYLAEMANRRKMLSISVKLHQCATDMSVDYDETINKARAELVDIEGSATKKTRTLADCIEQVYKRIDANLNPEHKTDATMTGYDMIDYKGGLNGGDLVVLVAGTSQGKTSFAVSIILSAIAQGKKILFFSMEMNEEQIGNRIIAANTGISCNVIRHSLQENQISDIDKGVGKLGNTLENLMVDDGSSKNIDQILASIRSHKYRYGISGVVIDYLQMMDCNLRIMTKEQAMADAARRLKNIAKELDIWVIALSQINRNPSDDCAPSLAKIRDSGQIAEAADIVMTIFRPEVYGREFPKPYNEYYPEGLALVKIEKGRNIGTGAFLCGFDPDTTRFYQLDAMQLENYKKNASNNIPMPF